MGQRSVPAPFLTKTYDLVDDRSSDDVISWGETGETFVVWKTAEFAKDLLPAYFKHNNFSSFVRQLNTYGFRKTAQDKWEFANENFKRGQKSLLTEIRRRKAISLVKPSGKSGGGNPSQWEEAGSPSTSSPESSKNRSSSTSPVEIAEENEKLRKENETLNSELFQMKQQYDELTAFLSGRLKVKPNEISQSLDAHRDESVGDGSSDDDDDVNEGGSERRKMMENEGLRLFGVWFKLQGKKRGRCYDDSEGNINNSMTKNANQTCPKGKAMKI